VLGYSPLQTGPAYLPFCAAFVGGLAAGAQMNTRFGERPTVVTAFLVSAAGTALLARADVDSTFAGTLLSATVLLSVGMAMGLPVLRNAALHGLSDADAGRGSGVQTSCSRWVGAGARDAGRDRVRERR